MTTLIPTYDTGGRTAPMPTVSIPPGREHLPGSGLEAIDGMGLDPAFIEAFLSAALTHERCGTQLYRSCAQRTNNPMLQRRYGHFGEETLRHVEILEDLIAAVGGDPQYVSPAARAVEKSNTATLESTFMLAGSVDLLTQEAVMLQAVLVAETIDRANWEAMAAVAEAMGDNPIANRFRDAVREVLEQEDEHFAWAHDTKIGMTVQQATHPVVSGMKATAADMMATIKGWFADDEGPTPGEDLGSRA